MEAKRGDLEARVSNNEVEIGDSRVRARFHVLDGGYTQEFLAADRKGRFHLVLSSVHKNLIPSSEHRACSSPMIAGDRPHLFAITRDSLRMVYSQARLVHHDEKSVSVELTGAALGHNLKCIVTVEAGSSAVHVAVDDQIEGGWSDPLVEYSMCSFAFLPDGRTMCVGEDLDYAWAPSLRPANDHVIGDASFHSPAVIVQAAQFAASIVPDLDLLGKHRVMPTCLDLDLSNGLLPAPLLSFGFCGYEQVHGGSYARHDMTHARRIGGNRLRFGFHVIVNADCKRGTGSSQIARFLWGKYGSTRNDSTPIDHAPLGREGRQSMASLTVPDAWAARGLHSTGFADEEEGLVCRARSLAGLTLTAPQDRGLFPTRYDPRERRWSGCEIDIGDAAYSTVECSTQLYWLLCWHKSVEENVRILDYCRAYADFLIGARQKDGAIPSWYDRDHVPLSLSRSGMQTAPSAAFLSKFAQVTGERAYARAAERSARYVLKEIAPRRLFLDGSLSNTADRWTLECPDPHTGIRPASGTAMLWIALMCLELGPEYLDAGRRVLDELCLLQSVWSKPWAPRHLEYGLVARGNVGAKYDPELTAEFARCAMAYGALTGERDYFGRGAAALRAVVREPGLSSLSQARVAASIAEVESRFGAVYIHVGGRWAVALDGWRVGAVDVARGAVSVGIDGGPSGGCGRIVFGGMRGKGYRVSVNGRSERQSRADMERGIEISGTAPRERTETKQLTLAAG